MALNEHQIYELWQRKSKGYLGSGSFSYVHTRRQPTKVGKVSLNDGAYLDFLTYMQQHPSEYFPKIYAVHIVEEVKGAFVVMENLAPFPEGPRQIWGDWIYEKFVRADDYASAIGVIEEERRDNDTEEEIAICNELIELCTEDFFDIASEVHYAGEIRGHVSDMHDCNIMFREPGQLVIVDPWCEELWSRPRIPDEYRI